MARFRGTVHGNRGHASRLGHHGITVDASGWELGVNVDGGDFGDADRFTVYATGGSNGRLPSHRVVEVDNLEGERRITLFGKDGQVVAEYVA